MIDEGALSQLDLARKPSPTAHAGRPGDDGGLAVVDGAVL